MKKALALFLCILMLTGCGQAASQPEKPDSHEPAIVLSADDSLTPFPIKATSPGETEAPAADLVAPAAFIPDNLFILSNGTSLKINGSESFSEEDILAAAETIPANAFDSHRQTAVLYDESQHTLWLDVLYEQYASDEYFELPDGKLMVLQSEVLPSVSARINRLCAPGTDHAALDADLAEQLTNYFRLKLADYNKTYQGIGCTLGTSDRVGEEWLQWKAVFAAQETSLGADYLNVTVDADIRSVTWSQDYLIIGVQEQLYIDFLYSGSGRADRMAFSTNHVLVLQTSDKGYDILRDFYACPILNIDTTEGIDKFVPAEAESLVWLMSYQEETDKWLPATYLWAKGL
ncbi:MAG: hypothetical protein IJZ85_05835 [Lachnospiraceae bacterium]|nr:hypothetical protein [Lachnospiraceae bacterium]